MELFDGIIFNGEPLTREIAETFVPRAFKRKEEKKARTRGRAEVFTPVWMIDKMVSEIPPDLDSTYLEITCGEAPFITTRYDPETGAFLAPFERVGVLDRKLRLATNKDEATRALQSVYGFELAGDSLYLARVNVWKTATEGGVDPETATEIVVRNFWQMDGLTGFDPTGKRPVVRDWKNGVDEVFDFRPAERARRTRGRVPETGRLARGKNRKDGSPNG